MGIDATAPQRDSLLDTELVLFVDDTQAKTLELNPTIQQRLGANHQVHLTLCRGFCDLRSLADADALAIFATGENRYHSGDEVEYVKL